MQMSKHCFLYYSKIFNLSTPSTYNYDRVCRSFHKSLSFFWGCSNGTPYLYEVKSQIVSGREEKKPEEQFTPKLAEGLPEMCFSLLPGSGQLICIKRGESGYYPSDWSTDDAHENRRIADEQNARLGISPAQEEAMKIGSLCGWDVPGADPDNCEDIVQSRHPHRGRSAWVLLCGDGG